MRARSLAEISMYRSARLSIACFTLGSSACGSLPEDHSRHLIFGDPERSQYIDRISNSFLKRGVTPVFDITREHEQWEIETINYIVDQIDGGSLIFGGAPNFNIDIRREFRDSRRGGRVCSLYNLCSQRSQSNATKYLDFRGRLPQEWCHY